MLRRREGDLDRSRSSHAGEPHRSSSRSRLRLRLRLRDLDRTRRDSRSRHRPRSSRELDRVRFRSRSWSKYPAPAGWLPPPPLAPPPPLYGWWAASPLPMWVVLADANDTPSPALLDVPTWSRSLPLAEGGCGVPSRLLGSDAILTLSSLSSLALGPALSPVTLAVVTCSLG